jgi:hypothetical protein
VHVAAADLVVVDLDASFRVAPASLHHRHPVTPYAGGMLHGMVLETWLRGRMGEPGLRGALRARVPELRHRAVRGCDAGRGPQATRQRPGDRRLRFDTAAYFTQQGQAGFYPEGG